MSKIILVNPKTTQRELFPSGALLLLGTILNKAGHKVKVIHESADGYENREELLEYINSCMPDIVGITVTTFNCKSARDLCYSIKRQMPKVIVAVGGPHTSALGREGVMYPPEADIWIVGEGDEIILDIAEGRIKNGIHFPEQLPNLDKTPVLDFSLTDIRRFPGTYPPGKLPSMFVLGSRGCPYNCTFCSRSVFGKTFRSRKPEVVVEETEKTIKDFGVKEVFFHDDAFNLNHEWAYELLGLLRKRGLHKKAIFRTPCRVNKRLVTEDLLREMKATNFWLIFFGAESGNSEMLKSMKKDITVSEITRAFHLCHKAGIKSEASFIIGMPGENLQTIRDSEKLWRNIKPYWSSFSRAIPFPGTELYKTVKEKGHLLIDDFEEYGINEMIVRTDELDGSALEKEAQRLDKLVMREKVTNLLKTHPDRLVRVAMERLKEKKRKKQRGKSNEKVH